MSVFRVLANFASIFRIRSIKDKPIVDNVVFRLHYRLTCAFFLASSALITAVELFGKPIYCMPDASFKRLDVIDTYCWINHTFTMLAGRNQTAHPGVGPESTHERRLHSYYQWVPFVLFFQGILFYTPHWIWKQSEGGIIGQLTDGQRGLILEKRPAAIEQREDKIRHSILGDYLYRTMGMHSQFGMVHVTCELLNLMNAMANIYLIDLFLGGAFFHYGWNIFELDSIDQEWRTDRLIDIFPRVTKCTFRTFGSSGTIQNHDALCILPLNVINEKIYVFVWFWLICLSLVSLFAIVYRAVLMISPVVRRLTFRRLVPTLDSDTANTLSQTLSYPDCYLLLLLAKNLSNDSFGDLMDELAHQLTV